jgi:hypothetical protein
MPKRILVAVGVVAVVTAIAVPVFVAAATPSPTIKPAVTANPVNLSDDKGGLTKSKSSDDSTTTTTTTSPRQAEPGDDKGGRGEVEPGDDKGGRGEVEPGDDKGGRGEVELGDDKGGRGEAEPGDERAATTRAATTTDGRGADEAGQRARLVGGACAGAEAVMAWPPFGLDGGRWDEGR